MARADISDPAIQEAINDIKNNGTPTNWILLGYVPKSDTKLKVVDTGSGGLQEVLDQVNDGKVLFALVSFEINKTRKFVYIAWCGEGVIGMKKGLFNNHANDVGFLFKGFHLQINARSEDDLSEPQILEKLKKASGASYDSGAKIQGQADFVPTSVAQGRTAATRSNVQTQAADKSDYKKSAESQQFWAQKREQEEQEKQQQKANVRPNTDYSKTQEREQFWAQQRQQQGSAPSSDRPGRPTPTPGGASAIRSKFEGGNNAPPPPSSSNRPALQRGPPPASKPPVQPPAPAPVEPEPVAEPEPVQSYQQEEEVQQQQEEQPQEQQQEYYSEEAPQQSYEDNYGQQQEASGYNNNNTNEQQASEEYYQQEEQQPQQSYEEGTAGGEGYDQQQQQESYQAQEEYYDTGATQQPQSGGVQARALYDYDAENPDDLSFKEGDIINVLDSSDPSGWWEGEINGVTGFFPSNFCELIQ